ncbi:MAG: peptidoglycan-binding protein [Candidatus Xenobiia bacterium LiM19]
MEQPACYPLKKGVIGRDVKLVQEWLCLDKDSPFIAIDGDFGSATEKAVKEFQTNQNLTSNGIVDKALFEILSKPMTHALKQLQPRKKLQDMIIDYAQQHLKSHPREVGGQNRGPWVRLYCRGYDGKEWPWCCGFVSYILKQACDTQQIATPFKYTLDCEELKSKASEKNLFKTVADGGTALPGDLFIIWYADKGYWGHTGIVLEPHDENMKTIEGNTNDENSSEGYEACIRIRSYENIGLISFAQ